MRDFQLVAHPPLWPQRCIICQRQKGTMTDTGTEHFGERVYICKLCAQLVARVNGYAEGEEMERLMHAREALDEKERELAQAHTEIGVLTHNVKVTDEDRARLAQELETVKGERDLLSHQLDQVQDVVVTAARLGHSSATAAATEGQP